MAEFVGQVFGVWDHLGVIPKKGNHVRLTAGQTGSGSYNEGLLTSESVSGSAPLVQATAVISTGPMSGLTIRLINTERSFLRCGSSGTYQNDQFQTHSHGRSITSSYAGLIGMAAVGSGNTEGENNAPFAEIREPTSRTSTETKPKNVGITYYLKVK